MERTKDTLGKIISRPPMTEKLLSRPPFKYLHDIFSAVSFQIPELKDIAITSVSLAIEYIESHFFP